MANQLESCQFCVQRAKFTKNGLDYLGAYQNFFFFFSQIDTSLSYRFFILKMADNIGRIGFIGSGVMATALIQGGVT